MKVTQEKLPASQIGLQIEVPPETTKQAYEKVLQKLSRSASIPGFRKGKVPKTVILQRIGKKQIKGMALEEIIQTNLPVAIEQESVEAIGNPKLTSDFAALIEQYEPGKPLTFSASVDVEPEVELDEYTNLSVRAEETVYEPKQVDDFLENQRNKVADLVPVEDRPAAMGDIAIIDFEGKLTAPGEEGELIEGGSATDFEVEMAEGKLIPGMIEGIVGMSPGETKEISVTFPEDYPQTDLAGKPAVFSVTLKELKVKELPELDDEFAQEHSEFETMAELRESLEQQFRERAEKQTKDKIHGAIIAELLEKCTVEPPETLVQEEVTNLLSQTLMQMQQYGADIKKIFTPEMVPRMREQARPEAITNLKTALIIEAIAKKEALAPTEAEIEEKMAEIREQLAGQEIDQDKLRAMVTEDLTREKTLDWLQEKATVELVPEGTLAAEEEAKTEEQTTEETE
ncbi:MAG: trigger factor [Cyanobacteria bacterium J083]|nr:MAG: trigger factor [Cyanobacteria bacterium J083]